MSAFRTNPMPIIVVTRLDLPYDIRGNGVPTTGRSPDIIPTLMNTWQKSILATPIHKILPNVFLALNAMQ